ncbi:MAG: DUF1638 domain-containing protein [Haloarculaceae archaeon]
MIGVVACEALYSELERLLDDLGIDAEVRYVPQELHEFPVNVPSETRIGDALQSRVDELDRPEMDRIVVSYATSGGGVAGLVTEHAPLVVSTADDCISSFIYRTEDWTMGEPKEFGTYYLSRGWIDCGVDSYKLYRAYCGTDDELLARFERAAADHPDMRVTWNEGELFERALDRRDLDAEQAGRFFHKVLEYFRRVKLIDNGNLYEFHRAYAEEFRSFVAELSAAHGDGHDVDLEVIDGDLHLLRTLLTADPDEDSDCEFVETVPAGTPVGRV